jgi:nucleotide-binding universal stress UspA family protein
MRPPPEPEHEGLSARSSGSRAPTLPAVTGPTAPLVVAYDGSPSAQQAIASAAELFPGAPALVTTVWSSVVDAAPAGRLGVPDSVIVEGVQNLNAEARTEAEDLAAEGAEGARTQGLQAEPLVLQGPSSVWPAIVELADERGAPAVVVGSRGRSGIASSVLGSVSHGVVQHCRRPVVVVRPAE